MLNIHIKESFTKFIMELTKIKKEGNSDHIDM